MIQHVCQLGAVASFITAAVTRVAHDQIDFSFPIMAGAIIATAAFTWGVAKYDASKTRRLMKMEAKIDKALSLYERRLASFDTRTESIEDRISRIEEKIDELLKGR